LLGRTFSLGKKQLSLLGQYFIGDQLAADYPYNNKIDNFIELETIENCVFTSIQDEEFLGKVRTVGTLQFYNRIAADIDQDDLKRLYYIRRLIGSQTKRVQAIETCLKNVVGMRLNDDRQLKLANGTEKV
jgi:hypothetical protein